MSGRAAIPPPVTQVLDAAGAWLPRRLGEVESRLGELTAGNGSALASEAAETLAAGGKRLRPILVLLCAGPGAGPGAVRAATAVELVHTATLVHDDVLDAASLRRGAPTVYARAGRGLAVAVGDLLLSRAFAELSAGPDDGADERRIALLSRASVFLARGELAQRRDAFEPAAVSAERYLERCRLKTASLFACACAIGSPPEREAAPADAFPGPLARFGAEVGLAFQLLDDVLDVCGPPERTGKARGTDLLDGTVTLPLILAREHDPRLASLELRSLDAAGAERACDLIEATGVLDRVRADARAHTERAKSELADAGLDPSTTELLTLVADGVVERYS